VTQNPTIKLPAERVEQLKAIGDVLGLSIADTVGHLIRAEIARGTISDALPGITIDRDGDRIIMTIDGPRRHFLPLDTAKAIAAQLRKLVAPGKDGGTIDLDANWTAYRVGNGIRVGFSDSVVKTLSRDVAVDLARLIEAAARD